MNICDFIILSITSIGMEAVASNISTAIMLNPNGHILLQAGVRISLLFNMGELA